MKRPVIGITTDHDRNQSQYVSPHNYALSVEKAGGLPLLIPYCASHALIPEIFDRLDGIVFAGGDDLDPSPWGETHHPEAVRIDPRRERFERALLDEIERRQTPTLGICLGAQVINVHRGGTLIQFLPHHPRDNAIEHRRLDDDSRRHPVSIDRESSLCAVIGETALVANTLHKQAIATPGRNLRVVATAPDGVIEGIEDPAFPMLLAVQWHPEKLHGEKPHQRLFEALVDQAARMRG